MTGLDKYQRLDLLTLAEAITESIGSDHEENLPHGLAVFIDSESGLIFR
jgi:hypothetical protein